MNNLPARETIAERACSLWEQAGQPTGRDEDFWLRAEADLTATVSAGLPPGIAPPSATPPPVVTASSVHQVPPPIKLVVAFIHLKDSARTPIWPLAEFPRRSQRND